MRIEPERNEAGRNVRLRGGTSGLLCLGLLCLGLLCLGCTGPESNDAERDGQSTAAADTSVGSTDGDAADQTTPDLGSPDSGSTVSDAAPSGDGANNLWDSHTGPDPATAKSMGALTYTTPLLWAQPLKDYGASASPVIHDLQEHQGKLYVGYGDESATLDPKLSVQLRGFGDPSKPAISDTFSTTSRQIRGFRRFDDTVWAIGTRTTEATLAGGVIRGNLYERGKSGPWRKQRIVTDGVYIEDIARYDGMVWMAGQGSNLSQRKQGDNYAYLWRGKTTTSTMTVVAKAWNATEGRARWTHLLPTKTGLMVFGYRLNGAGKLVELPHAIVTMTKDGTVETTPLSPTHPLKNVRVLRCWPVRGKDGGQFGVVTGVDILAAPDKIQAWSLTKTGFSLLSLGDFAPIDISGRGDEQIMILGAGNGWPVINTSPRGMVVRLSTDLKIWTSLLEFTTTDDVGAVAWWRGSLYFGTAKGAVLRAQGVWPG